MTAKIKLIRRNAHKMIAKIFEVSTTAKAYTLDNGFVGEPVAVEWVKKHTANIDHAEHYDNLNGTYTIRIHSNRWYELSRENIEPVSKPDVTPYDPCSICTGEYTITEVFIMESEKLDHRLCTKHAKIILELRDEPTGPMYRRKFDCGLCGLPVWAYTYSNGDYYLSCGCGTTEKRKAKDFKRESYVYAERGDI